MAHVMFVEAAGQRNPASVDGMIVVDPENPDGKMPPTSEDMWCCMQCVLTLQEDFPTERPLVQLLIEDAGHICLFLPRFHCELNPIEMLWGYGKYRVCISLVCMVMY